MNNLAGIIIGLLLGILVSFGALQFYGPNKNDKSLPLLSTLSDSAGSRTISASGESFVMAKPDIATIHLAVENRGPKLDILSIEINQKSALIFQRLKDSGILEKDIQSHQEINPQYINGGKGVSPRINGYEVRNRMMVKVRNVSKAGEVLDMIIAAGANSIESVNWGIEDDEKYKSQARANAVKLAISKLKNMADAADVDMGRLISLIDDYSSQQSEGMMVEAKTLFSQSPQGAMAEAGLLKISSRVTAIAEIK